MLVYIVYGVGEVQYLSLNEITATGDLNSVRIHHRIFSLTMDTVHAGLNKSIFRSYNIDQ